MNEKYYLVRVEELPWGVIERRVEEIKQAKIEYARLKHKFKNIPCTVALVSMDVTDDEVTEKTVYKKVLGSEVLILNTLKEMTDSLKKYEELTELHRKTLYEYDMAPHTYHRGESFKIHHGLELLKLSQTTGEERDQILYNLEESLAIRRAAKTQLNNSKMVKEYMKEIAKALKSSIKTITSAEESNKEYNKSSKSIKQNKMFFEALDLDYDEFYPVAEAEETTLIEVSEILDRLDIQKDVEEKYDEKYFEYEEMYVEN